MEYYEMGVSSEHPENHIGDETAVKRLRAPKGLDAVTEMLARRLTSLKLAGTRPPSSNEITRHPLTFSVTYHVNRERLLC